MGKIFLIILLITFDVQADLQHGPIKETLPESFKEQSIQELGFVEVGKTKFSVLFWDIYNSTLYTRSGSYLPETPPAELIFEINYLRDIKTKDLLDRTVEQWQHLGFSESQYNQFIPLLSEIWPEIYAGDTLALWVKDEKSIFYFNKVKVGSIEQKEFGKLFLAIWLSEKTSEPELRTELLGENTNG